MTAWPRLTGTLLLPDDEGYDDARRPPIGRFRDVRPAAVAQCASPEDVAAALRVARDEGLPVAVRSGGHSFAGLSSTGGLLIDVSPMQGVALVGGVVRAGAGTRLGRQLYPALAEHGRTVAGGCGATVGLSGLVLGGGLGLLGRQHGFTCDSLLAADVVLADEQVLRCDDTEHPDLFWALRGGGAAGLAVVTTLHLATVPEPATTTFLARWPTDAAAALLDAWQHWAPAAPRELACSLLLDVPADLDAPPVLLTIGAMTRPENETRAQLDELATLASTAPLDQRTRHAPYADAKSLLASDDQDARLLTWSTSQFFARHLPPVTVTEMVAHTVAGRMPGQGRQLDLSPTGGAYNDVATDATAFAHRDSRFLLKTSSTVPVTSRQLGPDAERWLADATARTAGLSTGGAYPNFPDTSLTDPLVAYHGANLPRLREVKAAYDPDDVLAHSQSVPPARGGRPTVDHRA